MFHSWNLRSSPHKIYFFIKCFHLLSNGFRFVSHLSFSFIHFVLSPSKILNDLVQHWNEPSIFFRISSNPMHYWYRLWEVISVWNLWPIIHWLDKRQFGGFIYWYVISFLSFTNLRFTLIILCRLVQSRVYMEIVLSYNWFICT